MNKKLLANSSGETNSMMSTITRLQVAFPIENAFAAAAAAQRINGAYIKYAEADAENNRTIMHRALTSNPEYITDEDRKAGDDIRRYFKRVVFKILAGEPVNNFEQATATVVDLETTRNIIDIGLIASLPSVFATSRARDLTADRINFATGGYVGIVGERVDLRCEVMQCFYSIKWGCFYLTGITDGDQVIMWSSNQKTAVGTMAVVRGTVKNHKDNKTKLGRVKLTPINQIKEQQ